MSGQVNSRRQERLVYSLARRGELHACMHPTDRLTIDNIVILHFHSHKIDTHAPHQTVHATTTNPAMSSPQGSPASPSVTSDASSREDEQPAGDDTITLSDIEQRPRLQDGDQDDDQESLPDENSNGNDASASPRVTSANGVTSPPPADVPPFDWEQFEARYESALKEADGEERDILQEAQSLSKVSSPGSSPSLSLVQSCAGQCNPTVPFTHTA